MLNHSTGQRMLAAALQTRRYGQCGVGRHVKGWNQGREFRLTNGERACLVKGHDIYFVRQLQRLSVFDQNTVLCGHAGARHDGRWRGQPKRAWAGNHQHRHHVDHSLLKRMPGQPPAQ